MEDTVHGKLERFFAKFPLLHYPKGSFIIRPEDPPRGIYYLKSGYVKFYSISPNGNELTLNIFKTGSYFPMLWAIGEIPNIYNYEAITEVEAWRASKTDVLEFLQKEPVALFELTKRAFLGIGGLLTRIEYLLFGDALNKVASVILMSAQRFGEKGQHGEIIIQLPLTHQEIANLASLARETTSLQVKKLERKGVIAFRRRRIVIRDLEKLRQESLIYQEEIADPHSF